MPAMMALAKEVAQLVARLGPIRCESQNMAETRAKGF
jgi:hypothetical protein